MVFFRKCKTISQIIDKKSHSLLYKKKHCLVSYMGQIVHYAHCVRTDNFYINFWDHFLIGTMKRDTCFLANFATRVKIWNNCLI